MRLIEEMREGTHTNSSGHHTTLINMKSATTHQYPTTDSDNNYTIQKQSFIMIHEVSGSTPFQNDDGYGNHPAESVEKSFVGENPERSKCGVRQFIKTEWVADYLEKNPHLSNFHALEKGPTIDKHTGNLMPNQYPAMIIRIGKLPMVVLGTENTEEYNQHSELPGFNGHPKTDEGTEWLDINHPVFNLYGVNKLSKLDQDAGNLETNLHTSNLQGFNRCSKTVSNAENGESPHHFFKPSGFCTFPEIARDQTNQEKHQDNSQLPLGFYPFPNTGRVTEDLETHHHLLKPTGVNRFPEIDQITRPVETNHHHSKFPQNYEVSKTDGYTENLPTSHRSFSEGFADHNSTYTDAAKTHGQDTVGQQDMERMNSNFFQQACVVPMCPYNFCPYHSNNTEHTIPEYSLAQMDDEQCGNNSGNTVPSPRGSDLDYSLSPHTPREVEDTSPTTPPQHNEQYSGFISSVDGKYHRTIYRSSMHVNPYHDALLNT